jgi:hypothetical protein
MYLTNTTHLRRRESTEKDEEMRKESREGKKEKVRRRQPLL